MATSDMSALAFLKVQDAEHHNFIRPTKRIHEGQDVATFLVSKAYSNLIIFLLQLNASMFPRYPATPESKDLQTWEIGTPHVPFSKTVTDVRRILDRLEAIIDEAPPDTGPRRFGNISFRKWHQIMQSRAVPLLQEHLSIDSLSDGNQRADGAIDELLEYFTGAFGSSQRLDYGTGHELSFLAFLGCLWMLGAFQEFDPETECRGIVLGIMQPYFQLVRRLIKTYTLEPAGSHGVWGLDDHSFIPYILGSAQMATPISTDHIPTEGSLPNAPGPGGVTKKAVVDRERNRNLYFEAIGFIYDVKKGPFWEHSPILYDISGIPTGWAKINKGMLKMYNAEVLSKFPVVQHFPFGTLFSWDRDPRAVPPPAQSLHQSSSAPAGPVPDTTRSMTEDTMRAPWASNATRQPTIEGTAAPWAKTGALQTTAATFPASSRQQPLAPRPSPQSSLLPTRAPWEGPMDSATNASVSKK